MRGYPLAVAAALCGAAVSPASAQNNPSLAPSTPWTLDYADDSCALRRVFGEGNDRIYLELRRFSSAPSLQTTVGSSRMSARNPANVSYRFGEVGEWHDAYAVTISMNSGFKSGVVFTQRLIEEADVERAEEVPSTAAEWRSIEQAAAANTTSLTVRGAFRRDVAMELGPMKGPIDALNECIDELMTHWGIDVEAHRTLSRLATPLDMQGASRMIGYPPKMIARSLPGLVNIRLAIDAMGQVTDCHIQMPLSDPEFEQGSCDDIRHAFEFSPALDKDGNPIASYWVTRVVFSLR